MIPGTISRNHHGLSYLEQFLEFYMVYDTDKELSVLWMIMDPGKFHHDLTVLPHWESLFVFLMKNHPLLWLQDSGS